jgi:hypothetical protein
MIVIIIEHSLGQLMLDQFEAIVSFLCPFESLLLQAVGNWSYQATEVPDEPPIEGGESMETPYVCNTLGGRPLYYSFDLFFISHFCRYKKTSKD